MNVAMHAMPWMAGAVALLALLAAIIVLTARSLFSIAAALAAMCACVAGALAALGYDDSALVFALFGAGVAPVLLLAGVVLTGRASRPRKRGAPWLSIGAGVAAGAAMLWAAPTILAGEAIAPTRGGAVIVLVVLIFVTIAGCAALLGYGERGVFGRERDA